MKKRWRRCLALGILSVILALGMVMQTRYTVNAEEERYNESMAERSDQSDPEEEKEETGEEENGAEKQKEEEENEGENSDDGEESGTTDPEEGSEADCKASRITLTPSEPAVDNGIRDVWGYYNRDSEVSVDVAVEEEDAGSGIQKIECWIIDGTETEDEDVKIQTLYEYISPVEGEETGGTEEDGDGVAEETDETSNEVDADQEATAPLLCWIGTIPVDTAVYHTCDVAVYVKAVDCSGNESISAVRLDIDVVSPQISLSFDNNDPAGTDSAGNIYFNKARTATVVITEQADHFDGEAVLNEISVTAKNALGEDIAINLNDMTGEWDTMEGDTPDAATHTVRIIFAEDANYTFSIACTDAAGNAGTVSVSDGTKAPYQFTVDTTAPTGTLTAVTAEGKAVSWDVLPVGTLDFSLKSGQSIVLSGVSGDMTSPVKSVCYFKTGNPAAFTEQELQALDEEQWKTFSGFEVSADENFAVYERIVDMAGNTTYIGTDGMIVDCTAPLVEELAPEPVLSFQQSDSGIYGGNVRVNICVADGCENAGGSGLKEITYRVLNTGKETQSGTLFRIENECPADLTRRWVGNIIVEAEKNNSNDVIVEIYASDNAGNAVSGQINLKIDISDPLISVAGVEDGHAYKGDVVPKITFSDINFDSYEVLLTRTDMYEIDADVTDRFIDGAVLTESGGSGVYDTFEKIAENDGIYKLSVIVSDLAGNRSEASVTFSVNRFGSVYVFSDYLVSLICDGGAYVQSVASDLVITEYNADSLVADSLSVEITRDGRPVSDTVYGVKMMDGEPDNADGSGWYRYKYTIDKDNFSSEGIYKIVISSEDAAGNFPENTNYADQYILFRVDRTAPEITSVTGLEESVIYGQEAEVTYTIFDSIGLKSVQAYVNGKAVGESVTDFDGDINNYTGVLTLTADAEPQTIRLTAIDLAGNVTDSADQSAAGVASFQETVTVKEEDDTPGLFGWFHRRFNGDSGFAAQTQAGRVFGVAVRLSVAGACAAVFLWLSKKRMRKMSEKKDGET